MITFYGRAVGRGRQRHHRRPVQYLALPDDPDRPGRPGWSAPILAYIITKRICLGLQRKDVHLLEHGVETGIIRQLPSGEFIEETGPVDEEARAVLESRPDYQPLPDGCGGEDADVPAPGMRGAVGKVRDPAVQRRHRERPAARRQRPPRGARATVTASTPSRATATPPRPRCPAARVAPPGGRRALKNTEHLRETGPGTLIASRGRSVCPRRVTGRPRAGRTRP